MGLSFNYACISFIVYRIMGRCELSTEWWIVKSTEKGWKRHWSSIVHWFWGTLSILSTYQENKEYLRFLAHLSWKLRLASLIICRTSVCQSVKVLLQDQWANFKQIGTMCLWLKGIQVSTIDGKIHVIAKKWKYLNDLKKDLHNHFVNQNPT